MQNLKNELIFKITQSNLKLGSLGIRGHNLKYFPGGQRPTKIEATFEKRIQKEPFQLKSPKKNRRATFVGEPINFRGMVYAPINEQGVVFLFGKIHDEIGIKVEAVRTDFPDVTIRRFNGRAWVSERAEFEYRSSHFLQHGHDLDKADIIICWINDWPDCPLEVIELKAIIEQLPS